MGEKVNDENKNTDRGNALETDPAVFYSDFLGKCVSAVIQLVDTKIVGSTLGTEALAAVGSVSTLHTLMTGFLNGLTLGFSLITAMCFGAKNRKRLKKTFAAAISLGVLTTLALVLMLMIFLHPVLESAACAAGAV